MLTEARPACRLVDTQGLAYLACIDMKLQTGALKRSIPLYNFDGSRRARKHSNLYLPEDTIKIEIFHIFEFEKLLRCIYDNSTIECATWCQTFNNEISFISAAELVWYLMLCFALKLMLLK